MKEISYRSAQFLQKIYEQRHQRNAKYSLRAFSRDLGVAVSYLSSILKQKRCLSLRIAEKFVTTLGLSDSEATRFIGMVKEDLRDRSQTKQYRANEAKSFHQMSEAEIEIVKNWEHVALLVALETKGSELGVPWLAKRLGLSPDTVITYLDRLEAAGLVSRSANGYQPTHKQLTTSNEIPTEALRQAQRQQIQHAMNALDSVPVELRDITSFCFSCDANQLPQAKTMIREFRRKFVKTFSGVNVKRDVYFLNIQLVPVTKPEN